MCVSLHPAHFSKTKGLACEAKKGRKIVHLLGYQNRVRNLRPGSVASGEGGFDWHTESVPSRSGSRFRGSGRGHGRRPQLIGSMHEPVAAGGGNALFLPIPAQPGTMGEDNVLDTTSAPEFMNDLERAVMPRRRSCGRRGAKTLGGGSDGVIVFEHDIYTVVLASDAKAIPAALDRVPADKRPQINEAIFKAYAEWYPGWTFALCCFNTAQEAAAKPLLWWYIPQNKDRLFFPALDAHDGSVPNLHAAVDVDHTIIVGSFKMESGTGNQVSYQDAEMSDDLRKLLPARVVGRQYDERMRNGDFLFLTNDVRASRFNASRALPPGAKTKN